MKQKDWILIIVIAFVSGVLSLLLSGVLFSSDEVRSQKVEVVPVISAELEETDDRYFNDKALNPARDIEIGSDPNADPFN